VNGRNTRGPGTTARVRAADHPAWLGAWRAWVDCWFRPIDPVGLHVLRVLAGILFLAWLLPFAARADGLFGLDGWFDRTAYRESARLADDARSPPGWSIVYGCGANRAAFYAVYAASLAVVGLFTLGVATRITSILTWIAAVSFTANPAIAHDADALVVAVAFHLMIGYAFLGLASPRSGRIAWFGDMNQSLWRVMRRKGAGDSGEPSAAANVALRMLQAHTVIVLVTSGLHKLQFGDWWAGVALWYPLHPPLDTSFEEARSHASHGIAYLTLLSIGAYATLAWQIALPAFAWKAAWRPLLLGGAAIGWAANTWIYGSPLFGPAIAVGCLAFVTPDAWRCAAAFGGRLAPRSK